ncbi:hypothetical protein SARC_00055 [Sphaeroforma arctica JP610]|uniref:Chloride channel protein n=1 Tax=Sphaeroforma arctica JP610 TaxID=667725 RepID=A0A0L0GHH9_9EUKA|nr:hypothetical protein SARC_00055 [Sphaeroforma arctica JP610]KNC87798.1 hypothetical protein SARC_00055 [Sphaeroforma arctica JP610]|eukprot:XP_014161700.1 hypothetical protein SARC_00055 [Sphaeroforma arctica JP610]
MSAPNRNRAPSVLALTLYEGEEWVNEPDDGLFNVNQLRSLRKPSIAFQTQGVDESSVYDYNETANLGRFRPRNSVAIRRLTAADAMETSGTRKRARSKVWASSTVVAQSADERAEKRPLLNDHKKSKHYQKQTGWRRIVHRIANVELSSTVLLVCCAVLSCFAEQVHQWTLKHLRSIGDYIMGDTEKDSYQAGILWVSWSFFLLVIAIQLTKISPICAGSGIPELKVYLSGVHLAGFFHWKTLFAKIVGLTVLLASGLKVGKAGPWTHINTAITAQLTRLPVFSHLVENERVINQILSGACANGIASCFTAPIGGVLFSIEVTTEYYMLSTYWKAFVTAICGAVCAHFFRPNPFIQPLDQTDRVVFRNLELVVFFVMGIVGGLLGGLFVRVYERMMEWRRKEFFGMSTYHVFPYFFGLISLPLCFWLGEYMRLPLAEAISDLTVSTDLDVKHGWMNTGSIYGNLVLYICVNLMLVVVTITLPIPAGVFMPLIAIGTGMGRVFGEIMHDMYPNSGIARGGYALVGGACLAGGATRSLSSAIIVLEVVNGIEFMLPALFGIMISITVGQRLSRSIYDSILYAKGLPYLPRKSRLKQFSGKKVASDLMRIAPTYVTQLMDYADLGRMLCDPQQDTEAGRRYCAGSFATFQATDNLGVLYDYQISPALLSVHDEREYLLIEHVANGDWEIVEDEDDVPIQFMSYLSDSDLEKMETQCINILEHPTPVIDPSPFQVVMETPFTEVHFMFTMLRCDRLYVTSKGQLKGVIELADLLQSIDD